MVSNTMLDLLFVIVNIALFWFIGKSFDSKRSYGQCAIGFVMMLGFMEIPAGIVVACNGYKWIFAAIMFITLAGLILVSMIRWKREKETIPIPWKANIPVILCVVVLTVLSIAFCRYDWDDSFYVGNATLTQHSSIINPYDSTTGKYVNTVQYDFEIWESLIAVVSQIFHTESVIVMHTFLLPVLLILSASANLFLAEELFERDKKKCNIFLCY